MARLPYNEELNKKGKNFDISGHDGDFYLYFGW
jgi:hypothetical protein